MNTLKIQYDEITESPREWDNITTMVCFHNRYNLGDKHTYNKNDFDSWQELKEQICKDNNVALIQPLYLYDHSGQSISVGPFNCSFDSGQIGWMFITKERLIKAGKKNLTKELKQFAQKEIETEVYTYNKYLQGEIYYYEVVDEDGDILDNCGGFYNIEDIEHHIDKNLFEGFDVGELIKSVEMCA